jgi:NAD(P)-dependent dehydrogenase (short-subunit alcohol dehydrogenase family)
MLLENKTAVIYGAGGAIGGAVARAFAREGARLFLTGRNVAKVEAVAKEIVAAGGVAETAQVDALDEKAVEEHLNTVVERAGGVDISFNAIGPGPAPDRIPLTELAGDAFARPIAFYTSSNFITATAAARHMSGQGSGVIVTLTAVPGRMPANLIGGSAPAWAAVEAFSRSWPSRWDQPASGWSACVPTRFRRPRSSRRTSPRRPRPPVSPPPSSRQSSNRARCSSGSPPSPKSPTPPPSSPPTAPVP